MGLAPVARGTVQGRGWCVASAHLLRVQLEPVARKLSLKQQQSQIIMLLRGVLEQWVLNHKTLVVVENTQWIDSESARLFLDVSSEFTKNVFTLFTSRPVLDPAPELQQLFELVETRRFLMRLGNMQNEDLIKCACAHLDVTSLPGSVASYLCDKSEGE